MLYLSKYFAICELIFNWMFWSFNIILIMIVFFSKSYNSNLRGTEETLLQNNPLDFLDKEIETPVTLRNLRASNLNLILLCIHSSSFLFLFILTFSFYVPNSECCDECPCDNENENENSNNDNRTCLFLCIIKQIIIIQVMEMLMLPLLLKAVFSFNCNYYIIYILCYLLHYIYMRKICF